MTYRCEVPDCPEVVTTIAQGWTVMILAGAVKTLCPAHGKPELMFAIAKGDLPRAASLDELKLAVHVEPSMVELQVTAIEVGSELRVADLAEKILAADPTPDELSVLELMVDRMFGKGRAVYGPLRIALDDRDFEQEALEELVDAPIYGAIGTIRRRRIRSAT